MPVTLAQAKLNTQDRLIPTIIDEFRKQSAILDAMPFDQAVNPMGGGSTLTYGYHRVLAERGAAFRAINSEYTPAEATKARFTVDLKPVGGSYQIDRVLAQTARGAEVAFQARQLIKASVAKFTDELINGDIASDANGFDGLDKALTGTTTEVQASALAGGGDWSSLDSSYHSALDAIDEAFALLDGPPSLVIGNTRAIAKFRAIARRANQYVERPVDDLAQGSGAPVVRGYYGNATLVDAGAKPGANTPIIPITSGGTAAQNGLTDLYIVRLGMDGYHGVAVSDQELVRQWAPDFTTAGAVKTGELEMGPVAPVLKATKAAAVVRGLRVQPQAT
jgi:hypothetical protein